jgi:hypothetical protein
MPPPRPPCEYIPFEREEERGRGGGCEEEEEELEELGEEREGEEGEGEEEEFIERTKRFQLLTSANEFVFFKKTKKKHRKQF